MPSPSPSVTVLLATFNGRRWLPDQVESILGQEGVTVKIIALDDGSTDGTAEWLAETAASDSRVAVLEPGAPTGSAAGNFYQLIERAPTGSDLVAFSDQDDLWMPNKLARHAHLISTLGVDAISSNVTSFTADGHRTLVRKDYPQRDFDYLLEGPGPGCTFLLSPRLMAVTRRVVADDARVASVDFHDTLIYAIARSSGLQWHIDGESSVDYRQHDANVMGSNIGLRSALSRLRLIRRHWHRHQAIALGEIGIDLASGEIRSRLEEMVTLLSRTGARARANLARSASTLRRRPRDQRIIAALIAMGVW